MRRAAALTLILLSVAVRAAAEEIVDSEGGYRLEVPKGWESFRHADRVELIDPNGTIKKNTLLPGTAKMWLRPIVDPDFWFEQLLNRDETRDVRRVPSREGADARFEYIDSLGHAKVDNVVSIVCRRVAPQWVCVVLEYRVDDPTPASHRALQAQVLESLRPLSMTPKSKTERTTDNTDEEDGTDKIPRSPIRVVLFIRGSFSSLHAHATQISRGP